MNTIALKRQAERLIDELLPEPEVTEELLALTAQADPVLAGLWDNEKDAAYDRL